MKLRRRQVVPAQVLDLNDEIDRNYVIAEVMAKGGSSYLLTCDFDPTEAELLVPEFTRFTKKGPFTGALYAWKHYLVAVKTETGEHLPAYFYQKPFHVEYKPDTE